MDYLLMDAEQVAERLSWRFDLEVSIDIPTDVSKRYTVTIRKNGLEAGNLYAVDFRELFLALRNFEKGYEFAFAVSQDDTSTEE